MLCIWAVSCVNDFDIAPPDKRAEGYSIEEARAFFDDYVAALPEIKTRAYDDHSLFGIDLSPQWDKAVASSRNSLSSIDIPILKNRQLMARTSGVPLYINSLQKLVIVKDHEIDVQGAYLLTLVPDLQYSHNKQLDPNNFVNLGDKNNYSGLAIYSLPLTEHIVRFDRYKDGEKIEGYGLFGTHEENHKALDRMKSIFGSISFGIGEMVQTRTIIEGGTLPPVIVTPDRCSWCGSTSCDGWCWTGGGGNTGCWWCGSSYCYGDCQIPPDPNPGGGSGGYNPPTNPPTDPDPDEPEEMTPEELQQEFNAALLHFITSIDAESRSALLSILAKFDVGSIVEAIGDLTAPAVLWSTDDNGNIFARIAFPPAFVSRVTNEGMNNAFAHEMWHLYTNGDITSLSDINEISDHSLMLTDTTYDNWLRAIFPGKNDSDYEILKYSGAENTPEYQNLPQEKKDAIEAWQRENQF